MNQPGFSRGAWWVVVLVLGLLLLNAAQVAYRFVLPTDGWFVLTTNVDNADWKLVENLVGAPSGLQRDDILETVETISVRGIATTDWRQPPAAWRAGNTVTYTVLRDGQPVAVQVPVVHWTLEALISAQRVMDSPLVTMSNLLLLAVAVFTFVRRPDVIAARALLVFSVAIFSPSLSTLLPDGVSVLFDPLAFSLAGLFSYSIYAVLVGPSLLAFSLYFPRPKPYLARYPVLRRLPVGLGLFALAFYLNLVVHFLPLPVSVLWFLALATMGVAVFNIAHTALTVHDAVERAQLRWAGIGFAVGILFFVMNFPVSFHWVSEPVAFWLALLANLAAPGIGLGIAIAILRYRLFDIDIIIRRTLTYALVTALLAVVFFGSVVLLQLLFADIIGTNQNELITVISTLAIAALFVPLRNRIQSEIDKRFNRKKYDVQQVLNDFANTVRDETDLENLTTRLMQVVDDTMQPTSVSVWLKREDR